MKGVQKITWLMILVGAMLTGCATISPDRGLGLMPARATTPDRAKKVESLFRALVLVDLPAENVAQVYRVRPTEAWMNREFVAKSVPRLDEGSVLVTRVASRAEITFTDGTRQEVASALMYQGWYYVFGDREIAQVRVFSADGVDLLIFKLTSLNKVNREVVSDLYTRIEKNFPKKSAPIGGHVVRYGPDAYVVATQVVDLTEKQEIIEDCGVLTVSSGEIMSIASGQFWAILPVAIGRAFQVKCVWDGVNNPRLLQKGSEQVSKK